MSRPEITHTETAHIEQQPPEFTNLLLVIWRRRWTVLLIMFLAWGAGAALYFVVPPVYESTAQFIIVRRDVTAGAAPGATSDEDHSTTAVHKRVLNSPAIIRRAIDLLELRSLPSLAAEPDPVKSIRESLAVEQELLSRSNDENAYFNLAYRSRSSDEATRVVTALVDSYEAFLNEVEQEKHRTLQAILAAWRDKLAVDLEARRTAYQELSQSPLSKGVGGAGTLDVAESRLAGLHAQKLQLRVRQTEAERQLAILQQARNEGIDASLLAELTARWTTATQTRNPLEDDLGLLRRREQEMRSQLGPRHPEIKALRDQVTAPGSAQSTTAPKSFSTADKLAVHIVALEKELQIVREVEESLDEDLTTARRELTASVNTQNRAQLARGEIEGLQLLYRNLVSQIEVLDLTQQADLYEAELISTPQAALKVAPDALLLAVVSSVLGLLLGCGLALVQEASDRRLRTPDDVSNWLDLPTVAGVPGLRRKKGPKDRRNVDRIVAMWQRPQSPDAEAFRRLATLFCCRDLGSILITSPRNGDGKSVAAANLACAMAETGRRVMLIDAATHGPCQHNLFGINNGSGLTEVLTGESDLSTAIVKTSVPGLSLLPSGGQSDNTAGLLHSAGLAELLAMGREDFDVVLIDGPSVLNQSAAWILAPQVQRVLLVVEFGCDARPVQRACRVLIGLRARIEGILINRLNRKTLVDYDSTFFTIPANADVTVVAESNGRKEHSNGTSPTVSQSTPLG